MDSENATTATPVERFVSRRVLCRDYWCDAEKHRPYQGLLHGLDDVRLNQIEYLSEMMNAIGCADGDEIEISIRVTGNRPFPKRLWKLLEPHKYGPVKREDD